MKRKFVFTLALLLALFSWNVQSETNRYWIAGSYAKVQTEPGTGAKAVAHLTTNTPVIRVSRVGQFCEITFGKKRTRGYLPCNLLVNKPILIEDVGDPEKSNFSASGSFWIEPTINRIFLVGKHLEATLLPSRQKEAEARYSSGSWMDGAAPKLKRFHVAEFEAMKQRLSIGEVAPSSAWTRPMPLASNYVTPEIELPTPGSSFFKSIADVASPSADPEQLSAQFGIARKIKIFDRPSWGGDSNSGPTLIGSWDIGSVEVSLTAPIFELAIGTSGEAVVGRTLAPMRRAYGEDVCLTTFPRWTPKERDPASIEVDLDAIFFRLRFKPVLGKVSIAKVEKVIDVRTKGDGGFPLVRATTTSIDFDLDGIVDVVVWDATNYYGTGGPAHDLDMYRIRKVFVNANAAWFLLDTNEEQACGC